MTKSDFSQAHAELVGTPWLAHLAGGAATAALSLAWLLLALGAPAYLEAYRDESIVLSRPAQLVLQAAQSAGNALGIGAALAGLAVTLFLWRRATRSGGKSTTLLFTIAGALAVAAVLVVLACANPLHEVQDLSEPR